MVAPPPAIRGGGACLFHLSLRVFSTFKHSLTFMSFSPCTLSLSTPGARGGAEVSLLKLPRGRGSDSGAGGSGWSPGNPGTPAPGPRSRCAARFSLQLFAPGTDGSSSPWVRWRRSAVQSSLLAIKAGGVPAWRSAISAWLSPLGVARPSTSPRGGPPNAR